MNQIQEVKQPNSATNNKSINSDMTIAYCTP